MDPKQRQFNEQFTRTLQDIVEETRRARDRMQVMKIKYLLGEIDYDPTITEDESNYN